MSNLGLESTYKKIYIFIMGKIKINYKYVIILSLDCTMLVMEL